MNKKVKKKIMTLALAAMLTAVSVMPAKAASEDVIDTSKTASLTIHKYDITAATQAGVNVDDQISTGKQNSEVEKKLADYAIKGVEFSYLRVGDVDTLSSGGNVKLIYEIPEALQKIIGLDTQNPVHTKDTKEYFTSQQINDSLKTALEDNTATKDKLEAYAADVKSNNTVVTGDKGNPNDVSLEWRRTSQEYYDVLRDQSIVYTFGIDLQKKFSDNNGDATKVKFVLQNQKDNYYVKATGSNGVYYVNGKSATEAGATEFSPAADGTLLINGIEGDTYVMTETHSDTGYSLLKEPMTITINSAKADITATTANITGIQSKAGTESTANDSVVKGEALQNKVVVQTTAASAKVDGTNATLNADKTTTDSEHGLVDMEVLNSKGFTLPKTGGDGLYLITILGVVLAGAGIPWSRKKNVAK